MVLAVIEIGNFPFDYFLPVQDFQRKDVEVLPGLPGGIKTDFRLVASDRVSMDINLIRNGGFGSDPLLLLGSDPKI